MLNLFKRVLGVATVGLLAIVTFSELKAQDTYGLADFSRSDVIPRDKMIDYWDLNKVNMSGDLLSGAGDMETGAASGGCTYCPTGAACACSGDSTVTQETTLIYLNNSSIKMVRGASGYPFVHYSFSATANTAYNLSFYTLGVDGTENIVVTTTSGVNYYNPATDVWSAVYAASSLSPVPTTWKVWNYYLLNDSTARSIDIEFQVNVNNKTLYIDNVTIQAYRDGTGIKGMKNNLTQTVSGNVSFGKVPNAIARPNQSNDSGMYGGYFDGVDSSLSTPDNAVYEPATYGQQFSWGCRDFITPARAGQVIGKMKDTDANDSYSTIFWSGNPVYCVVKKVLSYSALASAVTLTLNASDTHLCTYNGIADGSSVLKMYENFGVSTLATAVYPINNGNTAVSIGAYANGTAAEFSGSLGSCALWGKALSAIEAAKWINPHFPKPTMTNGLYPTACTHTAPEATCSYDRCRDGTPSACQVQGTGVQAVFAAATELAPNNSFETFTGTDAVPTITGWSKTEINGKVSMYRPAAKHGNVALRMKYSADGGTARINAVIPVSPSTVYYAYVNKKTLSGKDSTSPLSWLAYSSVDCTTGFVGAASVSIPAATVLADGVMGGTWTTGGTTNCIKLYLNDAISSTTDYSVVFDNISLRAKSYYTPWFHNPSTGTTSSTAKTYTLNNPLAETRPDGVSAFTNGFCVGTWVWTDFSGADSSNKKLLTTSLVGSSQIYLTHINGGIDLSIINTVGAVKTTTILVDNTKFTNGAWKYITVCNNNTGTPTIQYYNSANNTWYSGVSYSGAGDGILGSMGSTVTLGSYTGGVVVGNLYFHNLVFTPYSAINPLPGFNNRPTNRPY